MAVLALGLVATGFGTLPILRNVLLSNIDNTVLQYQEADVVDTLLSPFTTAAGELSFAPADADQSAEYFVAVYDRAGHLVTTAGGLDPDDPRPVFPESLPIDRTLVEQGRILALDGTSGAGFHATVWVDTFRAGQYDLPYTKVVAVPLQDVSNFIRAYFAVFTLLALATIAGGAFLIRWIVTLTFRRFGQVEATAMEIAAGDFSQRMTDIEPSTEIGRLKIAINTMLDRIDGAIDERDATVQQMRRFIGDASHELRTPLVSVRGYAELYRMGAIQGEEATAKSMERIEGEAKRMGVLVEDLLALTRLDERREIDIRPVDLRPIAHDAALDLRAAEPSREVTVRDHTFRALTEPVSLPWREPAPFTLAATGETADAEDADADDGDEEATRRRRRAIARASAVTLSMLRRRRPTPGQRPEGAPPIAPLDFSPPAPSRPVALPPVVRGDEDRIRQVVSNLLGNARRYTPEDAAIGIEVGVDIARQTGWIAVIDHGEGIPEAIREKVFQRFWRADSSRTRETGGSGLGLSIVSSIVSSLNGTVTVEETPGGGATFRVSLPLAREGSVASAEIPRPQTARPAAAADGPVEDGTAGS